MVQAHKERTLRGEKKKQITSSNCNNNGISDNVPSSRYATSISSSTSDGELIFSDTTGTSNHAAVVVESDDEFLCGTPSVQEEKMRIVHHEYETYIKSTTAPKDNKNKNKNKNKNNNKGNDNKGNGGNKGNGNKQRLDTGDNANEKKKDLQSFVNIVRPNADDDYDYDYDDDKEDDDNNIDPNVHTTFKVVFHVLQNPAVLQSMIPDKFLYDQIDVLNSAYSGIPAELSNSQQADIILPTTFYDEINGGKDCYSQNIPRPQIDTRIRFKLVKINRMNWCKQSVKALEMNSPQSYQIYERLGGRIVSEASVKPCSLLNVYITGLKTYLGWSSFPWDCSATSTQSQIYDGIFIDRRTLPGFSLESNYNQGKVLVHEIGHWLGLFHPQGYATPTDESKMCMNTDRDGDFVEDTPATTHISRGCPLEKDTCPDDPGRDPIHNFMDTSYDCCRYQFTKGQAVRIQNNIEIYRSIKIKPNGSESDDDVDKDDDNDDNDDDYDYLFEDDDLFRNDDDDGDWWKASCPNFCSLNSFSCALDNCCMCRHCQIPV